MKYVLPFDNNPYICQYIDDVFTLGIIQANAANNGVNLLPWLASKYNNCAFYNGNKKERINCQFSVNTFDDYALNDNFLWKLHMSTDKDLIKSDYPEVFMNWLSDCIRCGYYVTGYFNEMCIPKMAAFQKYEFTHPFIIYGFDESQKVFYSSGFLRSGRYSPYLIKNNVLIQALEKSKEESIDITLFKYNQGKKVMFNYERIIRSFEDYLESKNTISMTEQGDWIFGISAVKALSYHYSLLKTGGKYFDYRYSRAFSDSKKLICKSLQCLIDNFFLKDNGWIEKASQVKEISERIHYYGLMFNNSKDRKVITNITDSFDRIVEIEKSYLPEVIESLKNTTHFPDETYLGPFVKV